MTKEKSSGLAGPLCEKALDFLESEANVVAEFEGWEVAEASLFPDPRFRNAEELGEFARSQQFTRGVADALVAIRSLSISESNAPSSVLSAATRNAS